MQTEQLIREVREIVKRIAGGVDPNLADEIPDGCHNSLRWHLGHILITQDLLVLGLAGRPLTVPDEWRSWFAKGTSPADWNEATPGWQELRDQLEPMSQNILKHLGEIDLDLNLPKPYQTSTGPLLITVRDVAHFSAMHEAIHAGIMMAYKRVLTV